MYIPGVFNKASDTISCHPTGDTHPLIMHVQDGISAITQSELSLPDIELVTHMDAITPLHSLYVINWNKVCIATTSDTNMTLLASTIKDGIPEHQQDMPDSLRIYHTFLKHLPTIDGVTLYKDCNIIPSSLRQDCLTALHASHHGTSAMIARAESSLFWPGVMLEITSTCHSCNHYNRMDPSQPLSPPIPPHQPDIPSNASVQTISSMEAITTLSLLITTLINS